MIRKFSRRGGYLNLKKGLGISLTLMLALQFLMPGVLAINNALAAPAGKVNICHWSDDEDKYVAISPNANALNGHDNHEHDYILGEDELGEDETFNDEWCANNAPEVPVDEETGSLTVTKVVVGGTKTSSDFDLFVNGMDITSGVASTSIVVGTYTVTETEDENYEASFSGDCNAEGEVTIEEGESAECTITNTFVGQGGSGDPEVFKVKILKYVDGAQATASSADNDDFMFHASWDWTDDEGNHNGNADFVIDENGGIGGAPAYQAWTADMTGPADYSVHEITTATNAGSNVLPVGAQCEEGKYRLQGYKVGNTLGAAQGATLSSTSPTFTDINSERYVIVYNEKCDDTSENPETATLVGHKIICDSEADLPNWSGDEVNITASTASNYVASHPNCHLEPNWKFQWAPSGTADPGMAFTGEAGNPWTTFTASTTLEIPTDNFVWVREVLPSGYIPFTSTGGGAPNNDVSAEFYCHNDVLNYDNYEWIENMSDGSTYHCVAFNVQTEDTSDDTFMVKIYKYLDGVQATATSSGSYEFPMQSSWDWTDDEGNHAGSGSFTLGLSGHGGSGSYQAFTASMTAPADYAVSEITSNIDASSNVLPIGAQCEEGKYRLKGYRVGNTLGAAQIASLSTTSPVFTDIASERHVIVENEKCPGDTATTTGAIIVNKVVINNNSGTSTPSDFPLFVGSTSVVMGATTTLPLGTYTVSETFDSDLYAQSFSGDCNSSGVVTLSSTSTVVCTITNHDIPQFCPATSGMIGSDTNTTITGGGNAALLSFVHPAWTADVDGTATTSKWIWSTDPVSTTTATSTVTFSRTFTVNGSTTDANLTIASDNTYRVWINGNLVGSSSDGNNFQLETQDTYDVTSFLVDGSNTLTIEVTNEATPDITDPESNPAGLMYHLEWDALDCPANGNDDDDDNGQGGDNNVTTDDDDDDDNRSRSRTIVRGGGDDDDDDTPGTVLGISTINPNTPIGQVLGIASALPGLPNTGFGPTNSTDETSGFAVLIIGALVLSGVYLLQYKLLRNK